MSAYTLKLYPLSGLKVGHYYGNGKHEVDSNQNRFDVIVTTFDVRCRFSQLFHRKIIDESHQRKLKNFGSQRSAVNVWCVTGTPISNSMVNLYECAVITGHSRAGGMLERVYSFTPELIEPLRTIMIRHTKAQRINGDVALALPEASTEIMWLSMNHHEREAYQGAAANSMGLDLRRRVCANIFSGNFDTKHKTKLNALLNDINALRAVEPNMHVVVLTHYIESHSDISALLVANGYSVFGITGTTAAPARHRSISRFQERENGIHRPGAKVFVATMTIGNIGITLTAASRVYMYEPCIDPQTELQAAGRIHRLGQTKAVLFKKLVFRNSIESDIVQLHDGVRDGSRKLRPGETFRDALSIMA